MLKDWKFNISKRLSILLLVVLRLYSRTFRITIENEECWMDYLKSGGSVLLCTWHQQFFSAIRPFKAYEPFKPALMISKSQDGDIIARIAGKQGWQVVRGSSSRGGGQALREMVRRLGQSGLAAHIVDGPRGPAGVVKAGVISLARATGAVIVPFYTSADRAWYFRSWDRFMLPKPFARVTLRFGPLIPCPDNDNFDDQRFLLEATMRPYLLPRSRHGATSS